MEQSRPAVSLDDILNTAILDQRVSRESDWQAEVTAMRILTQQLTQPLETLLQSLVQQLLDLCRAGSAGVSLLETMPAGEAVFRVRALAGVLTQDLDGGLLRCLSPCSVCLDRGTPVLFDRPARYFTDLQVLPVPLVEGLMVPLLVEGEGVGTLWICSHDSQRLFDAEDLRLMVDLAQITGTALSLDRQRQELPTRLAAEQAEAQAEARQAELISHQSEQYLRALIQYLPGGAAFVVDRELRYQLADGEALYSAGFTPADFVGRSLDEAVPAELVATYARLYQQALAGEPFEHEHSAHGHYFVSRGTPLRDDSGEVYAVLAVSYDITDRKAAEAALRQSEARFRALAESLPLIVSLAQADGQIDYINPYWTQFSGRTAQDFITGDWLTAIHPDDRAMILEQWQQALTQGRLYEYEFRARSVEGSYRWLLARGVPVEQDGEITNWVNFALDIHDRRVAEVALRENEANLERELAASQQLQRISSRLIQEDNIDALYQQILDAAIAILQSEMGSIQMFHPDRNELQLLACQGFDSASAAFWEWVRVDSSSTCGAVLRSRERVIVTDVEACNLITGTEDLDAFRLSEIRAVQSTPLVARDGRLVGMISNHWRSPHQPSERELRLLDVLARQAADLIDRRQAEAAIAADLEDTQRLHELSARLVTEDNIQAVYQEIMEAAIGLTQAEAGTVQILDEATQELVLLATQGFERDLTDHFYRVSASSNTSCGRALITGERTLIDFDVPESEDPDGSLRLHVEAGYLSAQSTPLIARSGKAIGMVSTHWRNPHRPTDRELRFLDLLARQAADLIEQRQAAAAQRESETKYRTLFESIDEGFCLFELMDDETGKAVDYRFLEVNPLFEQQTGLKNAVGKRGSEIAPNTESYWLEVYDEVAKTGAPQRIENYNQATDRWYSAYASRVGGVGSRQVCTVFSDITDRKRREANLALLAEISEDFSSLASETEIMQSIGARLANYLRLDGFNFCDVDEVGGTTTVTYVWNALDVPQHTGTYRIADYMTEEFAQTMRRGEIWVVHDTQRDDRVNPETTAAIGLGAYIVIPYYRQGEWMGCFTATDRRARHWTTDEIVLIQDVTNRTFPRLERARAEAELRQSEAKYRSLFESIDEGYLLAEIIFDENDKPIDIFYLEANPAAIRLAGRDFSGQRMREIDPHYEDYWYEIYGGVALTGESVRAERYAEPHGQWFDFYAFKVGGPESRRVAAVFRDVTDRKHYEQRQAYLLQLGDALRPLADAAEIHATVTRIAMNFFGADRCYYCEILDDNVVIRRDASREDLPSVVGVYPFSRFPIFKAVIEVGHPLIVEDAQTTDLLDESLRQLAFELQIAAFINVPVIKNGVPIGAFVITQTTPRHWAALETELAQETAERTWAAVERARAEAALRDSEQRLSAIFAQAAVGLSEISLEGHFLQVNEALCQMLGRSREALLNTTVRSVTHPDDALGSLMVLNQLLETGESISLSKRYLRSDGSILWANSILTRLNDPQGQPQSVLIVTLDISDRIQAEMNQLRLLREQAAREQERQRAENLAELDRAKTAFFSNVSHEFRTPLTLILGPLEEVLTSLEAGQNSAATLQEKLQLAHRNSLRLLKLVNTLLDFSRIEADRLQASYQPTDLSTYTAELASVFRSTVETAGLQYVVDCPPLPEPVYVDREMWEKIVLNLISNAFKFTFTGEVRVSLSWVEGEGVDEWMGERVDEWMGERVDEWMGDSSDSTDAPLIDPPTLRPSDPSTLPPSDPPTLPPFHPQVILQVSDTGTGIPEADLPHLFDRFYQVKGSRGRSYEGSGIGLSLVQELVSRHGGMISVASTLGQGSCFTVRIPTGIAHLPADRLGDGPALSSAPATAQGFVEEAQRWQPVSKNQLAQATSEGVEASETDRAAAPEILLVDDNADVCVYIQRILSARYRIRVASNGVAALTAIQQALPDLVLTDIMMPEMDGFELLRRLRADPKTQKLPVILLSARASEEAKLVGLETGADDYLIKPFSARELLARIDAMLTLTQMRREVAQREQKMQSMQQLNDQLDQQVQARTAQLASVNQELEAFASAISHDLRVPLNYINTFIQRLRERLDPDLLSASNQQIFDIIEQSARQSEIMVLNLLEFSRLGRTRMQQEAVNLGDVVEQVLDLLQMELTERTIHWQIEPLPVVTGDPVLLRLVLQNLLSNAVKYTRQRTEARITVGSFEQAQEVVIFVQDNGAGFDIRYQDRLFSMFQRLHAQEEFSGTGVGLATVRRIVHRHGGRTWAEGAIDQGATFYFSLPKREVSP